MTLFFTYFSAPYIRIAEVLQGTHQIGAFGASPEGIP